jgi:hypothetical protein
MRWWCFVNNLNILKFGGALYYCSLSLTSYELSESPLCLVILLLGSLRTTALLARVVCSGLVTTNSVRLVYGHRVPSYELEPPLYSQ